VAGDTLAVNKLVADLRRLGIAAGDLVMVHGSLRAIGAVKGRAEGIVKALDAAVGPDGTLLMSLGARDDPGVGVSGRLPGRPFAAGPCRCVD
jgi:aminoglycoside 3-N-acetyltransferase